MKSSQQIFSLCLLLIDIALCYNYCEINLPKPDITSSDKFNIFTDSRTKDFEKLETYIPEKTYGITISIKEKPSQKTLTIKNIYALINDVQSKAEESGDIQWVNGGEIIFNVSEASKTEYCKQRAHVQYLYSQPQHVTFYWKAPKTPGLCLRMTIILDMNDNGEQSSVEERSHTICEETKRKTDQMQGDQSSSANCPIKKKPDQEKKCNILSTGVYRMTIENKWNSLNHWKDWPGKDGYTPKLTQYLG